MIAEVLLQRSARHGVWTLNGLTTGIPVETAREAAEYNLSRRIEDNPTLQSALGILGAEGFVFVYRRKRTPQINLED